MSKKFYFFEISYNIKGYQKVMFNRYKKIEAILSKSGYISASSKEVLKENLFKKQKEEIIKEINETGAFVFRDFLNCSLDLIYLSDMTNIEIASFHCYEATLEKAMKYMTISEIMEIYGDDIKNKILNIGDE